MLKIKKDLQEVIGTHGLDCFGSGYEQAGTCECGNELTGSKNEGKFSTG
jgi:hypothetical protein